MPTALADDVDLCDGPALMLPFGVAVGQQTGDEGTQVESNEGAADPFREFCSDIGICVAFLGEGG